MGKKDPRIDAYIRDSAAFARPILNHLRKLVHAGCPAVEETFKWSFPNFIYKGILCSMASFKSHCTFGFWKGKLVIPSGHAGKSDQKAMGQFGRITKLADLPSKTEMIGYIKKAAQLNEAKISSPKKAKPKVRKELVIPPYITAALRKNAQALAAFNNFTYSHKKEYVEWITEAKLQETRERRLAQALLWIAEAKPRHWKYEQC